jgi:DNA-binding CsgD family transcriptional regulator/tetratricopeptide (TPR) repeat protein
MTIERVRQSFTQGKYADTIQLTESYDTAGSDREELTLLRARAFLRTDPKEAIAFIVKILSTDATGIRGELLLIHGIAEVILCNYDSARSLLHRTQRIASETRVCSLAGYYLWYIDYMRRKFNPQAGADYGVFDTEDEEALGRAWLMKGWHHAATLQPLQQIDALLESKKHFERAKNAPSYWAASVCDSLARVAMEVPHPTAFNIAREMYDNMEWSEDQRIPEWRYLASRALAWCFIQRGDNVTGLRRLKEALKYATNDVWRMLANLDLAWLAVKNNEKLSYQDKLEDAEELAKKIDWDRCEGNERIPLLYLGCQYASMDEFEQARFWLQKFEHSRQGYSPGNSSYAFAHEVSAMYMMCSGYIRYKIGEEWETWYLDAYEKFKKMGYVWRMMVVTCRMAALTGDSSWLELAKHHAVFYPNDIYALEIAKIGISRVSLTDAERKVMRELRRSKHASIRELAQNLNVSENTIKTHIKNLIAKYGARNRAHLTALASTDDLS